MSSGAFGGLTTACCGAERRNRVVGPLRKRCQSQAGPMRSRIPARNWSQPPAFAGSPSSANRTSPTPMRKDRHSSGDRVRNSSNSSDKTIMRSNGLSTLYQRKRPKPASVPSPRPMLIVALSAEGCHLDRPCGSELTRHMPEPFASARIEYSQPVMLGAMLFEAEGQRS